LDIVSIFLCVQVPVLGLCQFLVYASAYFYIWGEHHYYVVGVCIFVGYVVIIAVL